MATKDKIVNLEDLKVSHDDLDGKVSDLKSDLSQNTNTLFTIVDGATVEPYRLEKEVTTGSGIGVNNCAINVSISNGQGYYVTVNDPDNTLNGVVTVYERDANNSTILNYVVNTNTLTKRTAGGSVAKIYLYKSSPIADGKISFEVAVLTERNLADSINYRLKNIEKTTATVQAYHGGINPTTGAYEYLTNACFFAVDCKKASTITFTAKSFTGNYGYAFYDENKNYISGAKTTSNGVLTVDVPSNAVFFRASINEATTATITTIGSFSETFPIFSGEIINYTLDEMLTRASYGSTINIPNGEYIVQALITMVSGVSIKGEDKHKTILKASAKNRYNNDFKQSVFYISVATDYVLEDVEYSNFTVDRTNSENISYTVDTKAFYAQKCKNSHFHDLRILNVPATGFGIDYLQNVVIENVYCYNCGYGWDTILKGCSGIGIGTGYYDDESFIITDCIVDTCGQAGIFIEKQPSQEEVKPIGSNQIVDSNVCKNSQYGILLSNGSGVVVSNNIVTGNTYGIAFRSGQDKINVTGNNMYLNTYGFYTDRGAALGSVLIVGNLIDGSNIGAYIQNMYVTILSNFITNSSTYDLQLIGNFANKLIAKSNVMDGTNNTDSASNFIIET